MTIFSKIIAGEIPSYTIAESDMFFAFLDIFPCTAGHTLVVPKIETDRLFDLPQTYLQAFLPFAPLYSSSFVMKFKTLSLSSNLKLEVTLKMQG